MLRVRRWTVRHARLFDRLYRWFEPLLLALQPVWQRLGPERIEGPMAAVESGIKGLLFDCRMCGQCMLTSSGMSCPMNCPKQLRNGPCGGVRPDGHCEVRPEMPCVWVDAWAGSRQFPAGDTILVPQPPIDARLQGRSSWLRVARQGPTRT